MADQEVGGSAIEAEVEIPLGHTAVAKRKRGAPYNAAHIGAIRRPAWRKERGYRRVAKKLPNYGFTEQGAKTACARIKETGSGSRKEGDGREFDARKDGV